MSFLELLDQPNRQLLVKIDTALCRVEEQWQVPTRIRHQHPLLDDVRLLWGVPVRADPTVPAGGFTIDTVRFDPAYDPVPQTTRPAPAGVAVAAAAASPAERKRRWWPSIWSRRR